MGAFEKREATATVLQCEQRCAELEQVRLEKVMQLGQIFLENNKKEDLYDTVYGETIKELESVLKEKDYQEKRKLAIQGQRKCESCGHILVLDSLFCNKCGEKLPPLFEEEPMNPNICRKCGNPVTPGALFCTSCGEKLQ